MLWQLAKIMWISLTWICIGSAWKANPTKPFYTWRMLKIIMTLMDFWIQRVFSALILNLFSRFYLTSMKIYILKTSSHQPCKKIQEFLVKTPSLPKIAQDLSSITSPIISSEVEAAIKQLHLGKAPSSDGLTPDFYLHFVDDLADRGLGVQWNSAMTGSYRFTTVGNHCYHFQKGWPSCHI